MNVVFFVSKDVGLIQIDDDILWDKFGSYSSFRTNWDRLLPIQSLTLGKKLEPEITSAMVPGHNGETGHKE